MTTVCTVCSQEMQQKCIHFIAKSGLRSLIFFFQGPPGCKKRLTTPALEDKMSRSFCFSFCRLSFQGIFILTTEGINNKILKYDTQF